MVRVGYLTTRAEPVGYPNPAVICGVPGCMEPGLVWLRGEAAVHYRSGQRLCFPLASVNSAKVMLKPHESTP
jgi:hypothetical protein